MISIIPFKSISLDIFCMLKKLGRRPIDLIIHKKWGLICYWVRVVPGKQSTLSVLLYKSMMKDHIKNETNCKWITAVKYILDNLGLSNMWISQSFFSVKWLSQQISTRQNNQYLQIWRNNLTESLKGKTYKLFKEELNFEIYLNIIPEILWIFMKFRTSNHYLHVETGRWRNILYENRLCAYCNKNDIGDEFHYLFVGLCTF